MHFLIRETLSFHLMYVAACYPVGTTISKTSSLFTALLQHYPANQMYRSSLYIHRIVPDKQILIMKIVLVRPSFSSKICLRRSKEPS